LLIPRAEAVEAPAQPGLYFVATNNFKVKEEYTSAFEEVWKNRESHLNESPGFIRFALLRGDTPGEYVSQTFWASRQDFDTWTKSKQFGQAHGEVSKPKEAAGSEKPKPSTMEMLEGRPQPKFYEAVTVTEAEMF
jgi:heme-degrading monooxygenase HmoA